MDRKDKSYYVGCLIGGAIGDALGAPIEFMTIEEIKGRYGSKGIQSLSYSDLGKAIITDDTQMTLFTAEGLLRAYCRMTLRGICSLSDVVYRAYIRWLHTQGEKSFIEEKIGNIDNGWLISHESLFRKRAPGVTCISALRSGKIGSIEAPINDSKGCGGVMRMAPVGLFPNLIDVFKTGTDLAALTHGNATGYLAAGVFAKIIQNLICGLKLEDAINDSLKILKTKESHEECLNSIQKALHLVNNGQDHEKNIEEIGEGWIAEEALAISLYCALSAQDNFEKGILLAVNHSGDSDSTGSITGNILGALLGVNSIPENWIGKLELANVVYEIAEDIYTGFQDTNEWYVKYPGG